jgi:ascorbate-specific PTS system EIIC-type component UlaA
LEKKGGVGLSFIIGIGDIYILYIIHKTQTYTKFYYIQGHLSMQDSAAAHASIYLNLRNGI